LVLVLESWIAFKEYVEKYDSFVEITYRMDPVYGSKETRVRIVAGRYGVELSLPKDDPTLQEIREFLEMHNARRIVETNETSAFFS